MKNDDLLCLAKVIHGDAYIDNPNNTIMLYGSFRSKEYNSMYPDKRFNPKENNDQFVEIIDWILLYSYFSFFSEREIIVKMYGDNIEFNSELTTSRENIINIAIQVARYLEGDSECIKHKWVSSDNEVSTGGIICLKCNAIKANEGELEGESKRDCIIKNLKKSYSDLLKSSGKIGIENKLLKSESGIAQDLDICMSQNSNLIAENKTLSVENSEMSKSLVAITFQHKKI